MDATFLRTLLRTQIQGARTDHIAETDRSSIPGNLRITLCREAFGPLLPDRLWSGLDCGYLPRSKLEPVSPVVIVALALARGIIAGHADDCSDPSEVSAYREALAWINASLYTAPVALCSSSATSTDEEVLHEVRALVEEMGPTERRALLSSLLKEG